jgi:beta-lactam-binding protein with PASTA domain
MAALLTTLLVLAVVGWSVGWLAASAETGGQDTSSSATPTPRASRLSASPSPSPSPSVSPKPFGMPKLVGKKFREARQQALDLRLDVTVRFDDKKDLPPGTVARTLPEEGVLVRSGFPIILYVTGPAPKVDVPVLAGKTCAEGRDGLVQAGLRVDFPSGDKGNVVKTEPPALTELAWNDSVKIFCAQTASP